MKTTVSPPLAELIGPSVPSLPARTAESSQAVVALRDPEPGATSVRLRTRQGRRSNSRPRTGPLKRLMGSETGMATAEYAITTLAAVGLAGLLVVILRSEEVRGFLLNVIRTALSLP